MHFKGDILDLNYNRYCWLINVFYIICFYYMLVVLSTEFGTLKTFSRGTAGSLICTFGLWQRGSCIEQTMDPLFLSMNPLHVEIWIF